MLNFVPLRPTYDLSDQSGKRVSPQAYRGRWQIVFFGFTHCKVVCPRSLGRISAALDELGASAARFQPLYVTVDPARDTPERMSAFLSSNFPRFTGLTGTEDEINAAKAAFRVSAARKEGTGDDYDVPHSALVYILDPAGEYAGHFGTASESPVMAAELRDLLTRDDL